MAKKKFRARRMDARPRVRKQVVRTPGLQRNDAEATKARNDAKETARDIQRAVHMNRDTWRNSITRLGERFHDKRLAGRHFSDRIPDLESEDLWRGDGMAARAVEEVPHQILRAGLEIQIQQDADEKNDRARRRRDRIRWMKSEAGRNWWNKRIDSLRAPAGVPAEEFPKLKEQLRLRITEDLASEVFPEQAGQEASEESKELQESVNDWMSELNVFEEFIDAMKAENGYGGAAIFPIIRDGETDLSQPLVHEDIQSIDGLDWLTPLELIPFQWYADPTDINYGRPQLYWMQRISIGNIGATARVPIHESRLITFPGVYVSRRQLREHWGWGDSVLVRMKEALRDFQSSHQATGIIVDEFATPYLKVKGLAASFASKQSDLLTKRATAMQEGLSIARIAIIDAEEDYGRITMPVTGLPDLLEQLAKWLAAHIPMPITILMGEAPKGLNATGAMDIRAWYDSIDRNRKVKLARRLRKFMEMVFAAKEGPTKGREPDNWSFKWGHLWQPTEGEQAQARYVVAQADQIYIEAGVLLAEEVAKSRFGGDEYSPETQLDPGIRETADDKTQEEAEHEAAMNEASLATAQANAKSAKVNAASGGAPPKGGGGGPPPPKGDAVEDPAALTLQRETELNQVPSPALHIQMPPKGKTRMPPVAPDAPAPGVAHTPGGASALYRTGAPATPKKKRKPGTPKNAGMEEGSGEEEGPADEEGKITAGEQQIPTTGDYRHGAGGLEAPPQPPTEAGYPTPKDTGYRAAGPEVPVGKLQGPQSV